MASNYSPVETQASVSEVIKAVGSELRELHARHREVTNRIRHLRIAVDALRELEKGSPLLYGEIPETPEVRDEPPAPMAQASAGEDAEVSRSINRRRFGRSQNMVLRRACRIALLETADAISVQDIYARISRRGSFSFASETGATRAIARELDALASDGEVRRAHDLSSLLWQRILPSDQNNAS